MTDALPTLPDLPSGWVSGGPLTVLVLVVLLFLGFMLILVRIVNRRADANSVGLATLASDLTRQHGQAMERQLEHCKEEVTTTIRGYVGQVSILSDQNESMWKLIHKSEDRADRRDGGSLCE